MPDQIERPYFTIEAQTLAELTEKVNQVILKDRYAIIPGIFEYTDERGDKWYVKELVAIYLAKWANGTD
jgi:hypothetical protein